MGFESCVLLNHDCFDREHLDRWGESVLNAILSPGKRPTRFPEGQVIYTDHMDGCHLVVSGSRQGLSLATVPYGDLTTNTQVSLLKIAAEHLGYKLVKKR